MARAPSAAPSKTIPRRGDVFPTIAGRAPDGSRASTRDYYLRRNLAIIVAGDAPQAAEWIARAAQQRDRAQEEVGEILVIAPSGVDVAGLPTIIDDGALALRLGLERLDTPALFIIDRFGTVFATNAGDTATPHLQPEDIPGWLEFIACRCT